MAYTAPHAASRIRSSLLQAGNTEDSHSKKIQGVLQSCDCGAELALNKSVQKKVKKLIRKEMPISSIRSLILRLWNIPAVSTVYETICAQQQATDAYSAAAFPTFSLSRQLPEGISSLLSPEGLEALKRVLWAVNEAYPNVKYCPVLPCIVTFSLLFLSETEAFLLTTALVRHSETVTSHPNINWHLLFSQSQHQRLYTVIKDFIQNKESKVIANWERNGINVMEIIEELVGCFYVNGLHWNTLFRLYCCYLSEGMRIFIRFTLGMVKRLKPQIQDLGSTRDIISAVNQALGTCLIADKVFSAGISSHLPKVFPRWQAAITLPDCIPLQVSYTPLHSIVQSSILEQREFQKLWRELPPRFQLMTPVQVYSSDEDGIHLPTLLRKSKAQGKTPGIIILVKSLDEWKFGVFVDSWLRETEEFVGDYESFFFILQPKEGFYHISSENHFVLHVSTSDFTIGEGPHGPAFSVDTELVHGYSAVSTTFGNEVISTGSFVVKSLELFALTT